MLRVVLALDATFSLPCSWSGSPKIRDWRTRYLRCPKVSGRICFSQLVDECLTEGGGGESDVVYRLKVFGLLSVVLLMTRGVWPGQV